MKHWCCLFTCLVTRGVDIEVLKGLDTDACRLAITNFKARGGRPHTNMIDIGTEFVQTPRQIRECFNEWMWAAMCERLARGQNIWKFNPPGPPHYGRIWERLVRSWKKAMFAFLGNQRLTLVVRV